jgi:hypothetical protein
MSAAPARYPVRAIWIADQRRAGEHQGPRRELFRLEAHDRQQDADADRDREDQSPVGRHPAHPLQRRVAKQRAGQQEGIGERDRPEVRDQPALRKQVQSQALGQQAQRPRVRQPAVALLGHGLEFDRRREDPGEDAADDQQGARVETHAGPSVMPSVRMRQS